MSVFSPLLIVSFEAEEAVNLTNVASGLGYPDAQIIVSGIAETIAALGARTTSPDYLIIDIAGSGTEVFTQLEELALHCDPKIVVVIIGLTNDIGFYRELRSRGIAEYFPRPVKIADLRDVLLRVNAAQSAPTIGFQRGTVISFASAASGDGASTLAANFSYCLAEELQQKTVLIDMDYQFGWIAKSLDLTTPFGIRELFDYPERGVDELLVDKMLVKYGKNLSIVASPHELRQLPNIPPEVIRDLISLLREKFNFVILDIPHVWTPWTAAAITYSDHVVIVAQLWLRSLTHASRLLAAWQSIGVTNDTVSIVINRSGAKFKEAITAQDFERVCHNKIEAYLNNDIKTIFGAETMGKTIFEIGRDTLLQQQIRQFTKYIVANNGTARKTIDIPTPPAAGGFTKLLSFLGKK